MADETATWGGLTLEVPPPVLEPIITSLNNILEMLIVVLDIVLVVLDIVKVFIVGLLGPILALLDALIALVEALANDLSKLGLYIRLDSAFTDPTTEFSKVAHEQLRGGFQAWETRCFNWMIDTKDPKRPDFSTGTGTLGLFFYASVDWESIIRLYKVIMSIYRLFGGKGAATPLQTPNNLKYEMKKFGGIFGMSKIGVSQMWGEEELPTVAELSWGYAASPSGPLGPTLPALPPDSVVIELSTVPEGYMVGYSRTQASTTGAEKRSNGFLQAPLDIGGGPLRIYGGTANLVANNRSSLWGGQKIEAPDEEGKNGLWFVKNPEDPDIIHLDKWVKAEDKLKHAIGQNQIVLGYGGASGFMSAVFPNFVYDLKMEDCPYGIKSISNGEPTPEDEPAKEVYVRISSGTEEMVTQEPKKSAPKLTASDSKGTSGYFLFKFDSPLDFIETRHSPVNAKRSMPSAVMKLKFPSEAQKTFMQMIKNAACIAYLCRGDLDNMDGVPEPSGFEPLMNKLFPFIPGGKGVYAKNDYHNSRKKVAIAAQRIADSFDDVVGFIPEGVLETLVETHGENLNFTIGSWETLTGTTIGTATDDLFTHCSCENSFNNTLGIHLGKNKIAKGKKGKLAEKKFFADEGYMGMDTAVIMDGSIEQATTFGESQKKGHSNNLPVILGYSAPKPTDVPNRLIEWKDAADWAYVREMFSKEQVNSALTILNIATNFNDGKSGWIAIRPLEALMLPIEQFLDEMLEFLKNVREGLMAIIKQILDYIRMIEARIVELQQLVRKIQAILRMFADMVVSADLHLLVVTGAGTQGLISEFMAAEEKPSDSPTAYGTGVAVVAGGLPLIIVDLLKAIFAAGDKPGGGASDGSDDASATDLLEGEA